MRRTHYGKQLRAKFTQDIIHTDQAMCLGTRTTEAVCVSKSRRRPTAPAVFKAASVAAGLVEKFEQQPAHLGHPKTSLELYGHERHVHNQDRIQGGRSSTGQNFRGSLCNPLHSTQPATSLHMIVHAY